MRSLGYPPGWLEEARQQHSGLSLFDDAGKAEVNSDEEGEIICPGDKDKYDIKKIIDFPGFNILTPEGVHDVRNLTWHDNHVEPRNFIEPNFIGRRGVLGIFCTNTIQ